MVFSVSCISSIVGGGALLPSASRTTVEGGGAAVFRSSVGVFFISAFSLVEAVCFLDFFLASSAMVITV